MKGKMSKKRTTTLSVCMIVKNEEKNLARALRSIAAVADEIVVVDTGSTDKTVEIAKGFGCKVFHEEWTYDFSVHRNSSIEKATGDWILVLDADEELTEKGAVELREAIDAEKDASGYVLQIMNVYNRDVMSNIFILQVRAFRSGLGFHYRRKWHNELVHPEKVVVRKLTTQINHYGYDLTPEEAKVKQDRLEKMSEIAQEELPNDPYVLYNAAEVLRSDGKQFRLDKVPEIIELTRKACMLSDPRGFPEWATHVMALNLCGWAYLYGENIEKAVAYGHKAVAYKPNFLDSIFLLGLAYKAGSAYSRAIHWLNKYLEEQANYMPANETDPIPIRHLDNRADAYIELARIYTVTKQPAKATMNYLLALKTRPNNKYSLKYLESQELTKEERALMDKFQEREKSNGKHREKVAG